MKKSISLVLGVAVIAIMPICDVYARGKEAVTGAVKTTPRIADEPYVGGDGDKVEGAAKKETKDKMTVEEAQKRLEQGVRDTKRESEDKELTGEGVESELPKYVYFAAGIAGGGFARDAKLDINGFTGAYALVEYRLSKAFGVSFDSYGGWLMGKGRYYYSALNLGIRYYPMSYRNPNFEFLIELGGHALDMVLNNDLIDGTSIGQGGYAGAGIIIRPKTALFGLMIQARGSLLYMEGPTDQAGDKKRRLAVPVVGMISILM